MTQLIVIDIAPLMVLLCNCHCSVIARSLICNYLLLKDISFNTESLLVWGYCWFGVIDMFGTSDFWDKSPS